MSDRASPVRLHIPSLDGIRCLSFLIVFAAHAGLERVVPGGFGVTVFFFLSGYLITTLLRLEWQARWTIDMRSFYARRAIRIWPPFYVVLSAATLLAFAGVAAGHPEARAVAAQAAHVTNYWAMLRGGGGVASGTGVYWSLAVEEHFYLLFPWAYWLLCLGVSDRRAQAIVVWGACAAVLAWRIWLVSGGANADRTYLATDTRCDSLLFGCAMAIWQNPALDPPGRVSERAWKFLWAPASAAVLIASFAIRDPWFRGTLRYTLQGIALGPLFVVAVRFPNWPPLRLLRHPIAAFGGKLSYSLYLVHHVVLEALAPALGVSVVRALCALAISVALAWAVQRLVEVPASRLRSLLPRTSADALPARAP